MICWSRDEGHGGESGTTGETREGGEGKMGRGRLRIGGLEKDEGMK